MSDPSAQLHGPGGLLATPGLGVRRRKGKKWGQRLKDTQIKGNLYRSETGKFSAGNGAPSVPKRNDFKKPLRGAKKPRAGVAAKKPKLTDAERQQARADKKLATGLARATERAQNRQKILESMNIAPDGQAALGDLADGQQPSDPKAIERGGFEQAGLVERATDGSYRMTASGRAAMAAAAAGDAGRAGSIISSARDRVGARTERTSASAAKKQATQARREQVAARRAEIAKKKRKKVAAKPSSDIRQGVQDVARQARQKSFTVFKDATGTPRWLARTTTAYRDRDGEIISEAALDADSQRMTATKAFGPLRYWHVGQPDPFDESAPWGQGLDIGQCDYSVVIGRTRVESGTFSSPMIAEKVARVADRFEMSPGFFHPLDQPDESSVFNSIRTFERSLVPTNRTRASNLFTGFTVKELHMELDEMERRFKAAITDLGLSADQAATFGAQLVATEKAATQQGIAFKDIDTSQASNGPMPGQRFKAASGIEYIRSPSELDPTGDYYAVEATKAFPPKAAAAAPAAAPMDAEDDPALGGDSGVDEAAEGEPPIDGQDMAAGDYIGDMSWDEFSTKLSELLAPVLKMQDMHKGMTDALGEMKAMYGGVATKSDGVQAEIASLKARLAEIEGDQPATILPDEVEAALKSEGPAKPHEPERKQIESTPERPWAGWAAQSFPELYKIGENG